MSGIYGDNAGNAMRTLVAIILALSIAPAQAGTKVWGFRGAGFEAFSQGVDQIAEQARAIPGVTSVAVYNYYETQAVYDQIIAAKAADRRVRVAIFGYSCGANASVVTANAIRGNVNEVLGMQPSIWCGGGTVNHINRNVGYQQNTFAPCWQTLGLGCQQWEGGRRSSEMERQSRHLYADEDPAYQQDVLGAIDYLANYQVQPPACDPARHRCHGHTLIIHRAPGGGITHTLIHR
jgi:hypothetical protein